MSFEQIVAVGAALLLLGMLWLLGAREFRRVVSILAIVMLAGVTTIVLLARSPDDEQTGTPGTSPTGSVGGSATPSAAVSPTGGAEPTASPTVLRHEVGLQPGRYLLFTVDPTGVVTGQAAIRFDEPSKAPVDRVEASNGLVHWRTVVGGYTGWSYIPGRSGPFGVREVVRLPDGEIGYREIDPGS